MAIALIIIVFLFFFLHTFTFRFQRATLYVAKFAKSENITKAQANQSPVWIGLLGWIDTILWLTLPILLFIQFSWIHSLVFLCYTIIGTAILDNFLPYPSYEMCFIIIKSSLKRDISKGANNPGDLHYLVLMIDKMEKNNSI